MKLCSTGRSEARDASHPARGAWIEIDEVLDKDVMDASHPARGAWIEMESDMINADVAAVAPRKGCVD